MNGAGTADDVDTVLLDLDDTLVRYRHSPGEVLMRAFREVGVEPMFPVSAYYERFEEFIDTTNSRGELRRECFAAIAEDRGEDPAVAREVADAFTAMRDPGDVEFLPGAPETLDALAAEYRLGVVTNGPPVYQEPKLDATDLDRWVETVVFAGHDTPAKPDPAPFDLALSRLDAAAARTVHVGDSAKTDVAGAKAAGLRAVWLVDGGETSVDATDVDADYRIDDIAALQTPPWR